VQGISPPFLLLVRLLYSTLFYALIPFVLGRLAWRGRKLPAYRERWRERFALYTSSLLEQKDIWFHAVSVGEAEAAFPIIRDLQNRYPYLKILVTCTTPTGSVRIKTVMGETVQHVYLPYDLPDCITRFLGHFQPKLGVIMETEIWPNLYRECRCQGIPLAIVNGRLSGKSARGYRRIGRLVAESLSSVALIAAQTKLDAKRYIEIGADPETTVIMGNVKFDIEFSETMREQACALRAELFGNRPVWIAGSTHPGEEEQILAALAQVRQKIPNVLLILAPRHPERGDDVFTLCAKSGFSVQRRSEAQPYDQSIDVFLIDSLGELRLFYGASDAAFVGGSLVPRGGHNVLEPAAARVPILFGPHMFNFAEIAQRLKEAGGAVEVKDSEGLALWILRLLNEPVIRDEIGIKGRDFVGANRGAVRRVSDLIASLLSHEQ
jgi:3-deoxy-D-manno-octulosonic-acid transferase